MAAPVLPDTVSVRKAVSLINGTDTGKFPRLLSRILQKLHLKAESNFSEDEEEKLLAAFSLEKQDLLLVLETISFILEQAVYHNLKPATLQQQLESIHLDQDKAEAFASAWAAAGQDTIEKFRQRILASQKRTSLRQRTSLQRRSSSWRTSVQTALDTFFKKADKTPEKPAAKTPEKTPAKNPPKVQPRAFQKVQQSHLKEVLPNQYDCYFQYKYINVAILLIYN
ncbi:COMM domain-containing protein 10 isoform X1 [Alligator mississippiensis]|uniref:COMM domain-containing protein 10 isoform X1 n=1 Tax=Alligator mississippiensis TaxID=8496 RepID=UPI0028772BF4|nr:COMM domain-containing protein 10 isoform X1 [Alligator mississippiensis]